MRTKQMWLGKQRTKKVEERRWHKGRSPESALLSPKPPTGSPSSHGALSCCETLFFTWVITTEDKEEGREGGRDR